MGVMEVLGGRIESEAGMAVLWLERVWIIWCISTAGQSRFILFPLFYFDDFVQRCYSSTPQQPLFTSSASRQK